MNFDVIIYRVSKHHKVQYQVFCEVRVVSAYSSQVINITYIGLDSRGYVQGSQSSVAVLVLFGKKFFTCRNHRVEEALL